MLEQFESDRWLSDTPIYAFEQAVIGIFDATSGAIFAETLDPILQKIESFDRLPAGWDYGRGGPIAHDILAEAKKWYSVLSSSSLEYVNAFPGINTVSLAGGRGSHRVEIMITKRGGNFGYGFAHDLNRKQQFYKTNLSEAEMQTALTKALGSMKTLGMPWNTYTFFTHAGMTKMGALSFERHFGRAGSLSPLSDWTVLGMAPSVPTFSGSIASGPGSPATQPFSCDLTQPVYQLEVA